MAINNIFDVASRSMSSQMTRLNTIATNLANAKSVASTKEEAFRPIRPVFEVDYASDFLESGLSTTDVKDIVSLDREPERIFRPNHPMADEQGFVWESTVNVDEEMVEMMETNRQYQNTLEVVSTLRTLISRTVSMGQ
ncbi:flagellar basal body rod protein FlgC [Donghicola tyrosinivorans]|uniref:Flagellar basal-body rod protein FlgC n=1 Tax=Donghicola tyrosinivorans TaxID=1652492 RepID=A0A2T0WIF7_9RHOB|nr:flagellar basal body rod protein FlgC [Donghicola tyrosinivorans]PRY86498.1 flagellar basal-body rod protein FlgC [Donghicola tyrosinivorans]